jgi:hypothetical protein
MSVPNPTARQNPNSDFLHGEPLVEYEVGAHLEGVAHVANFIDDSQPQRALIGRCLLHALEDLDGASQVVAVYNHASNFC